MFLPKQIFNFWASALRRMSLVLVFALFSTSVTGIYTYTRTLAPERAYAATSSNLNYQARLLNANGSTVPDGFYNLRFNLYSAASGGASLWNEEYYDSNGVTAGNDNRVRVVNGYLSVNLASQTAFPALNWDQDMWLTMNVGGSTHTATPTYDGEMTPRVKLTAVPYAFQAKQSETLVKTAGGFTGTVDFAGLTADRRYLLPDTNLATTASPGTVCVFNGLVSNCPAATGSASYIQNTIGGASPQTEANFNIQAYNSGTAGTVGGRIRGAANGQTVDLFQLQDSSGNILTAFQADGKLVFGPSGAQDTNLYRSAANTLMTDDALTVAGLLTGQAGLTVTGASSSLSGGIISLNASSNFATNINTGTSTGAVNIGNGAAGAISLNSGSTVSFTGTNAVLNTTGQLQLPTSGNTGGLVIGGDTNLYRSAADVLTTDDEFRIIRTTVGVNALSLRVTGEASSRFVIHNTGQHIWGDGAGAFDTNLYRSAADTLRTDDSLVIQGNGISNALIAATTTYSTGTIAQTTTAITGTGTTFTPAMSGGTITYSDGTTATITYLTATTLTSSVSKTVTAGSTYTITYGGFTVGATGGVTARNTTNSTTAFQIQNATAQTLFIADTTNQRVAVGPAAVPANGVLTVGTDTTTAAGGLYFGTDTNLYRSAANKLKTDDDLEANRLIAFPSGGAGSTAIATWISGSSDNPFLITNNGILNWGTGMAAPDVNLYRSAANTLATDDSFSLLGTGSNLTVQGTGSSTFAGNVDVAGTLAIGTADAVTITAAGLITTADDVAINGGDLTTTAGTFNLLNSATTVNLGSTAIARTVNIATGAAAQTVNIGSTNTTSTTNINGGSGGVNVSGNTAITGTLGVSSTADFTSSVAFKKGTDFSTIGTTNDANFGEASLIRLTGASAQTITGIANGRDGEIFTLVNSASQSATITNNDVASTVANRIITGTGGSITLTAGSSITLIYDSGASLWRVTGSVAATGGSGVNTIGAVDTTPTTANGARISGTTLYLQYADATYAGLVSTTAQTLAGAKTLTGALTVSNTVDINTGSTTALQVRNGATALLTADTTNGRVSIGTASPANGVLTIGTNSTGTSGGLYFGTDTSLYRNGANYLQTGGAFRATSFDQYGSGTNSTALNFRVTGDGVCRFCVNSDGSMSWGDGTAALDTSLYRSIAGRLYTPGQLYIGGVAQVQGTGKTALTLNDTTTTTGLTIGSDTNLYRSVANTLATDDSFSLLGTGSNLIVQGTGTSSFAGSVDVTGSTAFKKGTDFATIGTTNDANFGEASLIRLTGASAQTITGIANGRDGELLTVVNSASQSATITNSDAGSVAANRIVTGTGSSLTLQPGGSISLIYDSGASLWRVVGSVAANTTGATGAVFLQGGNSFGVAATLGTNDNFALNFRTNNTNKATLTTAGDLEFLQASTIQTNTGALTVDSASALNLGTSDATSVSISKTGVTTTVNGALTVAQLLTAQLGATISTPNTSAGVNAASPLTVVGGNGGGYTTTSTAGNAGDGGNIAITLGSGGERSGSGVGQAGVGGSFSLTAGNAGLSHGSGSTPDNGGNIAFTAGNGSNSLTTYANGNGGNVILQAGLGGTGGSGGGGVAGSISLNSSVNATTNINTGTSTGAVNIGGASAGILTLQSNNASAGAIVLNASNAAGGIDLDAGTGGLSIDSTGAISLDSTAIASNFGITANSASNAVLTLSSTNAGAGDGIITLTADQTINLNAGTIVGTATTQNLFNTVATTINFGGASTLLNIGPTGNGASSIVLSGGSADTGCTVDGATGNLVCSGNITGNATGTVGYWSRTGTTLSTASAGDNISTSGNLQLTSTAGTSTSGIIMGADTNLYRSAADTLKTDDRLHIQSAANSVSAFNILSTAGVEVFEVDTTNLTAGFGSLGAESTSKLLVSGSSTNVLRLNSTDTANTILNVQASGVTVASVNGTGQALFKNSANSTAAFQIQNATAQTLLVADTTNQRVAVGPAAVPANGVLTVGTDTTAATGGLYFGTDTNLYRSAANTLKTDDSVLIQTATNSTTAFQTQNSAGTNLLAVDTVYDSANLITNGGFETNTTGWTARAGTTNFQRVTTQQYHGNASLQFSSDVAGEGVNYPITLSATTTYTAVIYTKNTTSSTTSLAFGYAPDGVTETTFVDSFNESSPNGWTRHNFTFTTAAISGTPYFFVKTTSATTRDFFVDGISIKAVSSSGGAYKEGAITLGGVITSPVAIQSAQNTTSALTTYRLDGEKVFNVDTLNNVVQIGDTDAQVGMLNIYSYNKAGLYVQQDGAYNIAQFNDGGSAVLTIANEGATTFQNKTNSTTAFQIQNVAGTSNLFVADTTNTRIGIGTAAPQTNLHISATNTSGVQEVVRIGEAGTGSSEGGYIRFDTGDRPDQARFGLISATTAGSSLYFSTNALNTGAPTERMRITDGGQVVIGTTSGASGSGSGTITLWGTGTNGGTGRVFFGDGNTTSNQNVWIGEEGTGDTDKLQLHGKFGLNLSVGATAAINALSISSTGTALFQNGTNTTTAFQIQDSAGTSNLFVADTTNTRIGIGTASPEARLHVAGGRIQLDNDFSIRFKDSGGTARDVFGYSSANNTQVLNRATTGSIQIENVNDIGSIQLRAGASSQMRLEVEGDGDIKIGGGTTYMDTSGSRINTTIQPTMNPGASSTAAFIATSIAPTINYTAGGAGSVTALLINPTWTAVPTGNLRLIDLQNGGTSVFNVSRVGNTTLKTTTDGIGLLIQNNANAQILSVDTTNTRLTVGAGAGTLATRNLDVAIAEVTSIIRVGTSTNGVSFNDTGSTNGVASKLRLSGTARNSVTTTLTPEFSGATMTADGSNNTGTMTSDFCGRDDGNNLVGFPDVNTGVCTTNGDYHNYYSWTGQPTNDYDIWTRWQVPSDFDGWDTTAIQFFGHRSSSSAGTSVTMTIYLPNGTACGTATSISNTTTWTQTTYTIGACSVTPGQQLMIKTTLSVGVANEFARMGAITINYLSKF